MSNQYVFVYGTLLSNESNAGFLKDSRLVGKAIVPGELYNLGPYPAAWNVGMNPDGPFIQGEVWKVTPEVLESLDRLEGTRDLINTQDNLYNRVEVLASILDADGYMYDRITCWVYEYNNKYNVLRQLTDRSDCKRIKSGDWKKRDEG